MTNITAPFAIHAREQGDAVALQFDDEHLTWPQLEQATGAIAANLRGHLKPHARIALLLPHSPALALLFLAIARAGCEAQIGDSDWPSAMMGDVIGRLQPDLVIATPSIAQALRADMRWPGAIAECEDLSPSGAHAVFPAPGDATINDFASQDDSETPFYVGFTSGSTGLPKAYRRNHRSWLASFAADAKEFAIRSGDVVFAPGTLNHSLFAYALAHGLYRGARVVMMRKFHPRHALALMAREQASILYGVPTQ